MRILDGELKAQVLIETVLIETVIVEIGVVPELVEGFEIFESDKHAPSLLVILIRHPGGVDENPEVEIPEEFGLLSSRHARDFTLAPDMVYNLRPWNGDLDEDVVLEDFLCLMIDLLASLENGQLELISVGLFGMIRFDP